MRAVVQRVGEASVTVDGKIVGEIGPGFLILLGVTGGDSHTQARFLAGKIAKLRVFKDDQDKMNLSLKDIAGKALVVSQFTLYADTAKGNRPSFIKAAPPEQANGLYEFFCEKLREEGIPVQKGIFGARMDVRLLNDGPVTILMDTDEYNCQ